MEKETPNLTSRSLVEAGIILIALALGIYYLLGFLVMIGPAAAYLSKSSQGFWPWDLIRSLIPSIFAVLAAGLMLWKNKLIAAWLVPAEEELKWSNYTPVIMLRLILTGLAAFFLLKSLPISIREIIINLTMTGIQRLEYSTSFYSENLLINGIQALFSLLIIVYIRPLSDWLMSRINEQEKRETTET
jgi:hypothetical protein